MAAVPHRRRVVLFLAAVVFPSAVLVGVGIRLISQENELARRRLAEDRRAAVAEAGRQARALLGEVEARALRIAEEDGAPASLRYDPPALTFVARVLGGRIVPPWEDDPNLTAARRALSEPGFARRIREGERAEFAGADPRSAVRAYRRTERAAASEVQVALARLLTARALASFDRAAAEAAYLELLALPGSVMDESGVPFGLYAAARLLDWGVFGDRVASRLEIEIDGGAWRSPAASYLLADLAEAAGLDPSAAAGIRAATESAQAVLESFPLLASTRSSASGGVTDGAPWMGVGTADWLARATAPPGAEPSVVLAVSATALVEALNGSGDLSAAPGAARFSLGTDGSGGTALGIARPDLAVTLPEVPTEPGGLVGLRATFYLVTLLLVLGITLFGGYLLLQDVRRETRTAELRSDFVASVSHELKTPLTAIRMFAETLQARDDPDPATRADYLETIVGESERLTRLINNVLDLSRIEQGQKTYERSPASLPDVARRAARAIEYPMAREGFRLRMELDEDLPRVPVDADSVEQAVLNLLTNAMKYSGDSREIGLSLHGENGHAVISVRDRGIGVPPELRSRLGDKFYRVPSAENGRVPGTGLGLTIVEHTARAHGGHLSVDSEVGVGSTFSIHLPMEDEP